MNTLKILMVLGIFSLAACSDPGPSYDYTTEIEAANTAFETAYNKGDAEGVASFYTADAVLMPPGASVVNGVPAATGLWQSMMDSGLAQVDLIDEEIIGYDDTAINRGRFVGFDAEGTQIATGKYMIYWKRVDGEWKLHFDIWNLDG